MPPNETWGAVFTLPPLYDHLHYPFGSPSLTCWKEELHKEDSMFDKVSLTLVPRFPQSNMKEFTITFGLEPEPAEILH